MESIRLYRNQIAADREDILHRLKELDAIIKVCDRALGGDTSAYGEIPIWVLELNVNVSEMLQSVGVKTIGQLIKMTEGEISIIKGFGKVSLKHLKDRLAAAKLSLKA